MLSLALLACAAGIALGNWQSRRAEEKLALAATLDQAMRQPGLLLGAAPVRAADLLHQHVSASGTFIAERTVFLDNRNRRGKPGYEVVTPLALSASMAVLVQRGWVERSRRGEVRTPPGVQRIDGIAFERLPHVLQLGQSEQSVRQNLDISAYAQEIGVPLQPIVIRQHSDNDDGLARDWPPADLGRDTNRAYALQWYSLAALAAVLGLVFSFRRVA